jgi:hypothetical protein
MRYVLSTLFRNVLVGVFIAIPVGMIVAEAMIVVWTSERLTFPSVGEPLLWWLMLALPVTGVVVIHSVLLFATAQRLDAPLSRWAIILLAVACSSILIIVGDIGAATEPLFLVSWLAGGIAYGALAKAPGKAKR